MEINLSAQAIIHNKYVWVIIELINKGRRYHGRYQAIIIIGEDNQQHNYLPKASASTSQDPARLCH